MGFIMTSPSVDSNDLGKSVQEVRSWLYQLNENLRYMFTHLDEDNFSPGFLSSLTNEAIAQIEAINKRLDDMEEDSGWTEIAVTGVQADQDHPPAVRRHMKLVSVSGGAYLSSAHMAGDTLTIGSLTSAYRPLHTQIFPVWSESGGTGLRIDEMGDIVLAFGNNAQAGERVSLCACYLM
ncbi:MAG: hypothetical protein IJC48_08555 [Clostridia bacterium]|nr:hypothetical protein [Clostridia bacterium]